MTRRAISPRLAIKIESIIEDDASELSLVCVLRRWPAIKADLIADLEGLSGSIMVFGCGIVNCCTWVSDDTVYPRKRNY